MITSLGDDDIVNSSIYEPLFSLESYPIEIDNNFPYIENYITNNENSINQTINEELINNAIFYLENTNDETKKKINLNYYQKDLSVIENFPDFCPLNKIRSILVDHIGANNGKDDIITKIMKNKFVKKQRNILSPPII